MIFLQKKAPMGQDNCMWTIFYASDGPAKYKITLFSDQYFKYIPGPLYSVWIENRDGMCIIGYTGEGSHVSYPDGVQNWEDYFGKVRSLGWGEEVRKGLPDTDPRVKEIINDPKIKKLLDDYLQKYRYVILHDVFERFQK